METMNQIRTAHRQATIKKVIKTTKVEDQTIKTKSYERVSDVSLKAFAKDAGVLELVKQAHKDASKKRSEAKKSRTKLATMANRAGRKKSSSNKPVEIVSAR